jgi:hypothetical protein
MIVFQKGHFAAKVESTPTEAEYEGLTPRRPEDTVFARITFLQGGEKGPFVEVGILRLDKIIKLIK